MPTHFSYNSLYHNPEPPRRVILDAVSNFSTAIRNSLSAGVVRKRTFSLEFPRYVFNHLFNGKGTNVRNHTGRVYQREDFVAEWFKDNSFEHYNKHGEGCFVSFPIYMHSHVKFSRGSYDKDLRPLEDNFTETLFVKLVKTR